MRKFTAVATKSGGVLYVPPSHVIHNARPFGLCTVIINADGDLCRHPSYSRAEFLGHASKCAPAHESAIRAYRARQHPDILRPWDPELESWMGKHKAAILEGRMSV
jgi:hypothetical protein